LKDPAMARHESRPLAAAGRRLAAIDPNRVGIGGLRFQLELALFGSNPDGAPVVAVSEPPTVPAPIRSAPRREPPEPAATAPAPPPAAAQQPESTPRAAAASKPGTPAPEPSSPAPAVTAPRPDRKAALAMTATTAALDELLGAWPAIVAQLSAHPPTKPLVIACRPVAVDGAIVTLGFPEEQAFLKDAAERRRAAIETGIAAVLGRPVTVRCVVANVELPPAATPDADLVLAEARRIFADDIVEIGEVS
jgi:hypothetical protein